MSHSLFIHAFAICIATSTWASCRDSDGDAEPDSRTELVDAGDLQIDAAIIPRTGKFRMATWNIGCLQDTAEPIFCNTAESGAVYLRTQSHIDQLQAHGQSLDADMVFVQEVENTAALSLVFPGWQVQTVGSGAQQVGLAVSPSSSATLISVEPLEQLQLSGGLRPGLVATIDFDEERIQVLAVHLKTGCIVTALGSGEPACDVLSGQLNVISNWISERRSLGEMFILTGDFNRLMEGGEEFFVALQNSAGGDLHRTTEDLGTTCWHHHPTAPHFSNFIDHHILSGDIVQRWGAPLFEEHNFSALYPDAWELLSDHCPLVAEIAD